MSIVFHPDQQLPGVTSAGKDGLVVKKKPQKTGPIYVCHDEFFPDSVRDQDREKPALSPLCPVFLKIDWNRPANGLWQGCLFICPFVEHLNEDPLPYDNDNEIYNFSSKKLINVKSNIDKDKESRKPFISNGYKTSDNNVFKYNSESGGVIMHRNLDNKLIPGMNTAARAARRARQDAQYSNLKEVDPMIAKKRKLIYLQDLNKEKKNSAIEITSKKSYFDPTDYNNLHRSHSCNSLIDKEKIQVKPDIKKKDVLRETITVPVPVAYTILNANTVLFPNTSCYNNKKGNIIIVFKEADSLVSFLAFIDAIYGYRKLTNDRFNYTCNVKNYSPSELNRIFKSFDSELFNSTDFSAKDGNMSAKVKRDSKPDRFGNNNVPDSEGLPSPTDLWNNYHDTVNYACVRSPILNSGYLKSRLDECKLNGGGVGKGIGNRTLRFVEYGGETTMPEDPRIAGDLSVVLTPGGRILRTEDGKSLRPPSTSVLLSTNIDEMIDAHWHLQSNFDVAKLSYIRHNALRKRMLDQLFEERDRRRVAFLRQRSLVDDAVRLPTLTHDGPNSSPTELVKDATVGSLGNRDVNAVANRGTLPDKFRREKDAHWETFGVIADALGRRWERSTVKIDKLIMASQSPSRPRNDNNGAVSQKGTIQTGGISPFADIPSSFGLIPSQDLVVPGGKDTIPFDDLRRITAESAATSSSRIRERGSGSRSNMLEQQPVERDFISRYQSTAKASFADLSSAASNKSDSEAFPNEHKFHLQTDPGAFNFSHQLHFDIKNEAEKAINRLRDSFKSTVILDKANEPRPSGSQLLPGNKAVSPLEAIAAPFSASLAGNASDECVPSFSVDSVAKALKAEAKLLSTVSIMPSIPPDVVHQAQEITVLPTQSAKVEEPLSPASPVAIASSTPPLSSVFSAAAPATTSVEAAPSTVEPTSKADSLASPNSSVPALPSGWKEHKDPKSGRSYFSNAQTKKTFWKLEDVFKEQGISASTATDTTAQPAKSSHAATGSIPLGWKEHKDPKTGRSYYSNALTKKTVWKLEDVLKETGNSPSAPLPASSPSPVPIKSFSGTLPPGWKEHKDPKTGRPYYSNIETKKTLWKLEDVLKEASTSISAQSAAKLPSGWREAKDQKTGRTYYVNTETKQTSWILPV